MPDLVNLARRNLFSCGGGLATVAALPMRAVAGTARSAGLQIRKLSWAGILIETDATALFIDATSPEHTGRSILRFSPSTVRARIPAVLTPEQAVAAAQELRAGMVVPIHFGGSDPPRYVEAPHPLSDFQSAAAGAKLHVRVLQTGESFHLDKPRGC